MRGVTIRQLQIFATAAAHLSFARTSEQLHLTQAAVSIQVKQLEGLVGLALFERRGRKVHLTEAGEHLARYARVVLDALRRQRNANDYTGAPMTPDVVAECLSQAQALRKLLRAHLANKHPELLKKPA